MTPDRYAAICGDPETELTRDETAVGWHYCPDWDFMLIGAYMPEMRHCCCRLKIDRAAVRSLQNSLSKKKLAE